MNKIASYALLAGGAALIVYGVLASDSLGSDFSQFFTNSPAEKSIWLLISGIVVAGAGAGGLMCPPKST